jgi:hypothetical protein
MKTDDREIIKQCADFLRRSSRRYAKSLQRATKDLRRYSGNFWDDDFKKSYRPGKNRLCLTLNNWNVICNAISSPLSASPWHTELTNQEDELKEIQESIDYIEAKNDYKTALLDGFRKDVLTGYGFLVVSTDVDDFTGEPTIVLESVKHLQSVAMDPACVSCDGSDAEEGAVVNFIGVRKAKRLYGEDVAPMNYPETQPLLSLNGMDQWGCPEDQIAIVSYYAKEDDGVHFYKICGNKVVQSEVLPIKYIPIVRLAGNEIYDSDNINYNGIVQQTLSLELGANIAYSTLIERCGRSTKANYLIHVTAIDGLEKSYANSDKDDAMAVLWKGEHEPKPLVEQFATGDLQATVNTTRTLIEDIVGVPLTGIPDGAPEKTATEILRQQTSKESNTASYYNNAFTACQTISKILIELLNGGADLRFTLENGPSVITRQMKARQELQALATICPDELKPIIAKFFADTLEDDVGKDLGRNILANLPKDLVYLQDDELDPGAVHQLEMMKATLEECMAQLDEQIAANGELQKELDTAQISMLENREQRVLDWEKFKVSETNRMALETAKLEQSGVELDANIQLETGKLMVDAEKNQAKAQNDTDKVMLEAQKTAEAQEKVYREGEDAGYEQGVNDGVDAAYGR